MSASKADGGGSPLLVLLDLIDSPLLLFNAEGRVTFANKAAKASALSPALSLGNDPRVRQLVMGIAKGDAGSQTSLRVDVMSDMGSIALELSCVSRPIAGLVAAVVREIVAPVPSTGGANKTEAIERLTLQQIVEVLHKELMAPMQAVLAVPGLPSNTGNPVGLLRDRLDRLVDLVDVFGEDVLINDERILVVDLVRDICQSLASLCATLGVAVVFKGERDDLPPVYGSRRLLGRALHECIHNAVNHSRNQSVNKQPVAIEIAFSASGHRLLVDINGMGVFSAAMLQRHASTLFRAQAPPDQRPVTSTLQIGLPLSHRIVQLHGGQLRIRNDVNEDLQVTLELPTGAPLRNTQHLDLLQAQIYAEDLSKLMARSRARKTA